MGKNLQSRNEGQKGSIDKKKGVGYMREDSVLSKDRQFKGSWEWNGRNEAEKVTWRLRYLKGIHNVRVARETLKCKARRCKVRFYVWKDHSGKKSKETRRHSRKRVWGAEGG